MSRFLREYPDFEIRYTDREQSGVILQDMLRVEAHWLSEQEELPGSVLIERDGIEEAIKLWDQLALTGAVIYVAGAPVAMTIAAEISPEVYDIIFEKSYGEYAHSGGFAAINQLFARYLLEHRSVKWINREEDMGVPGLRWAKMAYHPDLHLKKFEAVLSDR